MSTNSDQSRGLLREVARTTRCRCLKRRMADRYGPDRRDLVRYRSDAALEAAFGCYPPLATPLAEALGFRRDGTIAALLRNALEALGPRATA